MRTFTVAIIMLVAGVIWADRSVIVIAQNGSGSCNTSPDRPTDVLAARGTDGRVLVAWTANSGRAATRFYVEASRGTSVNDDVTTTQSSVVLPLAVNNGVPWRVSVRGWNEYGLSPQGTAVLDEGSLAPPPTCDPLPAPTVHPAVVTGTRVNLWWTREEACKARISGWLIVASLTPSGPVVASIPLDWWHSNWAGDAPPGTYYVRVLALSGSDPGLPSEQIVVSVP